VICRSGTRSYVATRILQQHGFKVKNVPGGVLTRAML
jgi:rhodanese-related sulfurtransferase